MRCMKAWFRLLKNEKLKKMKGKIFGVLIAMAMIAMSFSMLSTNVLAAPTIAPIISDATDGIGTIYDDGNTMIGNGTSWVIGKDLTNQFNIAQTPEEIADSGATGAGDGGGH